MRFIPIPLIALWLFLAVALAGCQQPSNDLPPPSADTYHLSVGSLRPAPQYYVDWDALLEPRPAELARVFEKAVANNGFANSESMAEERADQVIESLGRQWLRQYPGPPPDPMPMRYEGQYFEVWKGGIVY